MMTMKLFLISLVAASFHPHDGASASLVEEDAASPEPIQAPKPMKVKRTMNRTEDVPEFKPSKDMVASKEDDTSKEEVAPSNASKEEQLKDEEKASHEKTLTDEEKAANAKKMKDDEDFKSLIQVKSKLEVKVHQIKMIKAVLYAFDQMNEDRSSFIEVNHGKEEMNMTQWYMACVDGMRANGGEPKHLTGEKLVDEVSAAVAWVAEKVGLHVDSMFGIPLPPHRPVDKPWMALPSKEAEPASTAHEEETHSASATKAAMSVDADGNVHQEKNLRNEK